MKFELNNFKAYFSKHILNRGFDYYLNNNITTIDYDQNHNLFTATIEGNEYYTTTATINNGVVERMTCTCPYHDNCKHMAALLYKLTNDDVTYHQLINNEKVTINNTDYFTELYNDTVNFFNNPISENDLIYFSRNFTFNKYKGSKTKIDFHEKVFKLFEDLLTDSNSKYLDEFILMYLSVHYRTLNNGNYILNILNRSNNTKLKTIYYRHIFTTVSNIFLINISDEVFKYFTIVIEEYRLFNLFYYILNTSLHQPYLKYTFKNQNESKVVNFLFKFFEEPTIQKIEYLKIILTPEELTELFQQSLDEVTDLQLFLAIDKNTSNLKFNKLVLSKRIIKDNFEVLQSNYLNEIIQYLERIIISNEQSITITTLDALNLIKLLQPEYDFSLNQIIHAEAIINKIVTDKYSVIFPKQGLPSSIKNKYQHLYKSYKTSYNYNSFSVLVTFDLNSNDQIFTVYNDDNKIELMGTIDEEGIDNFVTANHHLINDILHNVLFSDVSNELDIQYEDIIKDITEIRNANKQQVYQSSSLKLVDKLSSLLLDEAQIILDDKVELEVILSLEDLIRSDNSRIHYYEHDFIVGSKIGISQMYFVKNVTTLFNNIDNKIFFKYGKNLAFDHNILSFSPKAKEVVKVLERNIGNGKIKNNLGVILTNAKVKELLDYSKNSNIYLYNYNLEDEYEEFYMSDLEYEVKIELLENDLTVNLKEQLNDASLIITKDFDILIKDNNEIKLVNYKNQKLRKLAHFILENETFKANLVLKELIQKVIPLIKDEITISEEIEKEIKTYQLKVDSYFDYDEFDDKITVESKFYEGDILLSKDDLSKHQVLIDNYYNILTDYGFKNNEINDQGYIFNFFNADLSIIKNQGEIYISDAIKSKKVKKLSKMKVNISLEGSLIRAHIDSVDLTNVELKAVIDAYNKGKKYVILKNNVILTSDENLVAFKEFMDLNELTVDNLGKVVEKPIYEVFKLDNSDSIDLNVEEQVKEIMDDIINYESLDVEDKPKMYDILKTYQKEGFNWLKTLSKYNLGGILADDMGLGKTLQIISYLETEEFNYSIVICPKSLIYNWEAEIKKFEASFNYLVYVGSKQERMELLDSVKENKEKLLIITSYDTLRNDIEELKDLYFDNIILDEAQAIKTVNALKTQAVKMLEGNKKFVLTGTPIENSIIDLWSIFDFIMPNYLYTYRKFAKLAQKIHQDDNNTLDFLIKKTKPFILRRVKKDVLTQLPDKQEEIVYTTFDGENRKVYDGYLKNVQDKLLDSSTPRIEILSDLMRLRQICISPKLYYEDYTGEQLKVEAAINLIDEAIKSNHKVLVFSTFVKALDLLKENYSEEEYFILTGQTKAIDRISMTEKFNDESSTQKVFFISLKAGGTGLNLVGADIVIHLDPWWNVAAENQATDRAHRIGQKNTVNVYKIVMKGSIEEKIIELQNKKKDLFDKMIDNDEASSKLSLDDYHYLLK